MAWWALFGVGLLVAIWGWLWILQRLVRTEAEMADARIRVAEERYLATVAREFGAQLEARMQALPAEEETIPRIAREGTPAGAWFETSLRGSMDPAKKSTVASWRRRLQADGVAAEDLTKALESGELAWGWVEDGRDLVAGIMLSVLRRGGGTPELVRHLSERVWDYGGPRLKPAFRVVLIRALLEKVGPDDPLQRLLEGELIRVAEGRMDALGEDASYEVLARRIGDREIRFYWTKSQLETIANQGREERFTLEEDVPGDRSSAPVSGLRTWPSLTLQSGEVVTTARRTNEQALIWVGGATGLLVLGLAMTAAVVAHRQLRTARLRTDLAASVAHELRTPLAGQRLLLESLLERKELSKEQHDDYIAMAFRENKRLSRLAEEFLTFSRLERGVLSLEEESVDVTEIVTHAVESLREKWTDPDCNLTVDLDADLPRVAADAEALTTVLRNLLENAWKYSESPRVIEVRGTRNSDGVRLAVRDNGVGLSKREQERVFRQFYRVDRTLARAQEGLGLGLSIVMRLLEAMGGRIEVESTEGHGSEFRIWMRRVA